MRISYQTRLVLQALLDAPEEETYGFELSQTTGLKAGTLRPTPTVNRLMAVVVLKGRCLSLGPIRPRSPVRLTRRGLRSNRL